MAINGSELHLGFHAQALARIHARRDFDRVIVGIKARRLARPTG
jgi:hypothetical protein